MFGRIRRKDSEHDPVAESEGERPIDISEIRDEDIPSFDAPHVSWLKGSKGGPYYLAPDSAEPWPSGMWSKLKPDSVEKDVKQIRGGQDWQIGVLLPGTRKFLETQGALGERITKVLEGRSGEPTDVAEEETISIPDEAHGRDDRG